jgi:branched-subunit amino acid transport protein
MALSYKARRRWSLVILLIGLPAYIVAAVTVVNWLDRPSILVELLVYVGLGVLWALPFKYVFRGVGQADPAAERDEAER